MRSHNAFILIRAEEMRTRRLSAFIALFILVTRRIYIRWPLPQIEPTTQTGVLQVGHHIGVTSECDVCPLTAQLISKLITVIGGRICRVFEGPLASLVQHLDARPDTHSASIEC